MWELRAHGQLRSASIKTKSTTKAIPTPTHMMFVKLMQEGVVKAVISQNCDGLHRRSGLPVKGTCMEMACVCGLCSIPSFLQLIAHSPVSLAAMFLPKYTRRLHLIKAATAYCNACLGTPRHHSAGEGRLVEGL